MMYFIFLTALVLNSFVPFSTVIVSHDFGKHFFFFFYLWLEKIYKDEKLIKFYNGIRPILVLIINYIKTIFCWHSHFIILINIQNSMIRLVKKYNKLDFVDFVKISTFIFFQISSRKTFFPLVYWNLQIIIILKKKKKKQCRRPL